MIVTEYRRHFIRQQCGLFKAILSPIEQMFNRMWQTCLRCNATFHDNIDGAACHNEMLDVIAAYEDQFATAIDGNRVNQCQPALMGGTFIDPETLTYNPNAYAKQHKEQA
jgi:hypothetical protein